MANITNAFRNSLRDNFQGLGLSKALDDLDKDTDLNLFECEIGIFSKEDTNTPHDTHYVIVAAESEKEAKDIAVDYAHHNLDLSSNDCVELINNIELIL